MSFSIVVGLFWSMEDVIWLFHRFFSSPKSILMLVPLYSSFADFSLLNSILMLVPLYLQSCGNCGLGEGVVD